MGQSMDEDDLEENVCGSYPEHTEPNGLGCCKRCDAQLDPVDDDGDDSSTAAE